MQTTPQHIHTIPTSCAILPTMSVVCIAGLWKAMGRVVVHVDVHGECVTLWVAAM